MEHHTKNIKKLELLMSNPFEKELLHASLENLVSKSKLRFNNFAYSIRELSRHFLKSLSPDEEIEKCEWFKNDTKEKGKYSRAERIKYAIQGGLTDRFLDREILDLESLNFLKSKVVKSIELLNKYTHVNEDTFDLKDEDVEKFSKQVIGAFVNLAETIDESKNLIISSLEEKISEELLEKAMWEVSDEIDILATHHNIEDFHIADYKIVKIESDQIVIEGDGIVYVRLQWGSDGDLVRGDGHEMNVDFPFTSKFIAKLGRTLKKSIVTAEDYKVDTESWYE